MGVVAAMAGDSNGEEACNIVLNGVYKGTDRGEEREEGEAVRGCMARAGSSKGQRQLRAGRWCMMMRACEGQW